MRRLLSTLLVTGLTTATVGLTTASPVRAGTEPCVNTSGAGMSMRSKDMQEKGHGAKTKKKGTHGQGHAAGTSCPTVTGAREIPIVADAFTFTPNAISVAAGEDVTLALSAADIGHDLNVKGIGHVVHADADDTGRGGIRIDEPGTYRFWCSVPGHKKAGMTGTITVS